MINSSERSILEKDGDQDDDKDESYDSNTHAPITLPEVNQMKRVGRYREYLN
jgi:hypothetical protein